MVSMLTGVAIPSVVLASPNSEKLKGERQTKRPIELYNLDMILSIGYRVNSAEMQASRGILMRIKDWVEKLDIF